MKILNLMPLLKQVSSVAEHGYDGVLVFNKIGLLSSKAKEAIDDYLKLDGTHDVKVIPCSDVAGGRIIYSDAGMVKEDFDDARCFREAAIKAAKKAVAIGCRSFITVLPEHDNYPNSAEVTLMGILHALYTPVEVRESSGDAGRKKIESVGIYTSNNADKIISTAYALESGQIVARDIGGSDPERMAAPRVAEYVKELFEGTNIDVKVINDVSTFEKEYPLLAAVNRASRNVERHAGQVIKLTYTGEGPIEKTLMIVGKGITYDTGGADIKAGGIMAGMHRDKCGAAAVAGFFQLLSEYQPKGLKVMGTMAVVRNSIGSECYVSDEIITSRAGVRVRIGNTDAEGRLVMVDPLCEMKEKAAHETNPILFTWATLTGHVIRCYGFNYTSVMENGPARTRQVGPEIVSAGDNNADPCELTRIRREDFDFIAGPTEYEDVVSCNNLASSNTARGHQFPMAFLIRVSGLDKHGNNSPSPIPYVHMDIAGSSGVFPGIPTASPMKAMAYAYVLNSISSKVSSKEATEH